MLTAVLTFLKPAFSIIDKLVEDKDQATRIKAELQVNASQSVNELVKNKTALIMAEIKGESALQRNWRPILMMWFAILIGAHWLGFTAPNLTEQVVIELLTIVKVGLGGYVLGRSGEKIMKTWKDKK